MSEYDSLFDDDCCRVCLGAGSMIRLRCVEANVDNDPNIVREPREISERLRQIGL